MFDPRHTHQRLFVQQTYLHSVGLQVQHVAQRATLDAYLNHTARKLISGCESCRRIQSCSQRFKHLPHLRHSRVRKNDDPQRTKVGI